jgi:very-short-patch-repair endonuclease
MARTSAQHSATLLWKLSAKQHGVVTRRQLSDHGLSNEAVEHRLARGRLHRVGTGVYAVGRPQLSREGRWLAATLQCGPNAALSHSSGSELWGIRTSRHSQIEVTVPYGSPRRRPGIWAHRGTVAEDQITSRRDVPVVVPARVLLNQAKVLTARQLERDINVADALGLVSARNLTKALAAFTGEPGVVALRELLERHALVLTDSELERRLIPLALRAGLPTPQTRRRVNGFRVDFFWPSLGLVVETDGLRYHRTPSQQARDLRREQTHRMAGLEPLRFTHAQVVHEQAWVLRALLSAQARLADEESIKNVERSSGS